MGSEHGGSDLDEVSEEYIKSMIEDIILLPIEIAGQKLWREIECGEEALRTSYQALATMNTGGSRQDMERACRAELDLEMQAMKYRFELLCIKPKVKAEVVMILLQEQIDSNYESKEDKESSPPQLPLPSSPRLPPSPSPPSPSPSWPPPSSLPSPPPTPPSPSPPSQPLSSPPQQPSPTLKQIWHRAAREQRSDIPGPGPEEDDVQQRGTVGTGDGVHIFGRG